MRKKEAVGMTAELVKVETPFESEELAERWVKEAQVKPSSVEAYNKCVRHLLTYFVESGVRVPTRADMLKYREYLSVKYKASTAGLHLVVARLFLGFLHREGYLPTNPAEHLKGFKKSDSHAKSALSAEMTKVVLATFNTDKLHGKRDKAIFALMVICGLRCIEVARANIGDLENCGGVMRLHVQGKGRDDKSEAVNVPAGVYKLIREYLEMRGVFEPEEPLFVGWSASNRGGRLNTTALSKIVKAAMRKAGYDSPRLTAHSLRHTAATTALKSGASLREVQQMLRHKSVAVTQVYLHELDELENTATNLNADKFGL